MSLNQFNGLLIKNFNLLAKQKGTIICQILTPIFCLAFVFLIQIIVESNISNTGYGVKFDSPIYFNLPFYDKLAYANFPIKITTCEEWYMYDFDPTTPKEDIEFFGKNEGNAAKYISLRNGVIEEEEADIPNTDKDDLFNILKKYVKNFKNNFSSNDYFNTNYNRIKEERLSVESSGMLTSGKNIIQKYCDKLTDKVTPYFQQAKRDKVKVENLDLDEKKDEYGNNINYELFQRLGELNKLDFNDIKAGKGLNILPDGTVYVKKANKNEFVYRLQINDNKFPFYHKTNGVSMIKIYNPNTEKYNPLPNVMSGALWIADLFNKAYMKMFHPDLYVISGIQPMPFELNTADNVQRIINLAGSTFYPIAVSLLMPLFMYTIVLEKESRLVEIMKINGLKMTYYWFSLFLYNFIIYCVTFILFYFFGRVVFAFKMFTDTSNILMFLIFVGWGFSQISLAFFFQAFLSNARTSTSKLLFI